MRLYKGQHSVHFYMLYYLDTRHLWYILADNLAVGPGSLVNMSMHLDFQLRGTENLDRMVMAHRGDHHLFVQLGLQVE